MSLGNCNKCKFASENEWTCRRFPPQVVGHNRRNGEENWRVTEYPDCLEGGCGEFKPKKETWFSKLRGVLR